MQWHRREHNLRVKDTGLGSIKGPQPNQRIARHTTRQTMNVRFTLKADEYQMVSMGPLCPISDRTQRSKKYRYSITSSARTSSVGGTSRPSALAVFRLMTSWNLTGA